MGPNDPRLLKPRTRSYVKYTVAYPDYKPQLPIYRIRRWDTDKILFQTQKDTTLQAVVHEALSGSIPMDFAAFTGAYLWGLTTPDKPCSFEFTNFGEANLAESKWKTCRFKRTNFRQANLAYSTFRGCTFDGVDFDEAILTRAVFYKCQFHNCTFQGISRTWNFRYCKLRDCKGESLEKLTKDRKNKWLLFQTEILSSV